MANLNVVALNVV